MRCACAVPIPPQESTKINSQCFLTWIVVAWRGLRSPCLVWRRVGFRVGERDNGQNHGYDAEQNGESQQAPSNVTLRFHSRAFLPGETRIPYEKGVGVGRHQLVAVAIWGKHRDLLPLARVQVAFEFVAPPDLNAFAFLRFIFAPFEESWGRAVVKVLSVGVIAISPPCWHFQI